MPIFSINLHPAPGTTPTPIPESVKRKRVAERDAEILLFLLRTLRRWEADEVWLRRQGHSTPDAVLHFMVDSASSAFQRGMDLEREVGELFPEVDYLDTFDPYERPQIPFRDQDLLLDNRNAKRLASRAATETLAILRDTPASGRREGFYELAREYLDLPDTFAEYQAHEPTIDEVFPLPVPLPTFRIPPTHTPAPTPSAPDAELVQFLKDFYSSQETGGPDLVRTFFTDPAWARIVERTPYVPGMKLQEIGDIKTWRMQDEEIRVEIDPVILIHPSGEEMRMHCTLYVQHDEVEGYKITFTGPRDRVRGD
jgi:hypothetical protein